MQENYLFEYAVIRVVPRVEREEFINVGVILYAQKLKFLGVLITLNNERLIHFCPTINIEEVAEYLMAIQRICTASAGSGPIGKLDIASRFRWLTAARSTVVQCSKVHVGLCADANATLKKLHEQLVL